VLKLAVLISGGGTNLQALIDACREEGYPAEISVVISNKPDAYGLVRAQEAGLKTEVINHKEYVSRETFDEALHELIKKYDVGLVCLAGFMRLLTPGFVNKWPNKMINIHPSLLPDFKGVKAQRQALEAGVSEAGCTVHFVIPEMDAGPIILQERVPVKEEDTEESLTQRILEKEHICYVEAVRLLAEDKVQLQGGTVKITV
jgi:phosphoribosylglycinamide formyltransferase-1